MEAKDYAELFLLVKGAEKALVSGQLSDWQHANTSTFHVLASMILDINERVTALSNAYDRLARVEVPSNKPLVLHTEFDNGN